MTGDVKVLGIRWFTLILVGTVAILVGYLPGGLELRVIPVRSGAPLLVLPLRPGERFTLHYYHSVENAPIWEEHSVDERGVFTSKRSVISSSAPAWAVCPGWAEW